MLTHKFKNILYDNGTNSGCKTQIIYIYVYTNLFTLGFHAYANEVEDNVKCVTRLFGKLSDVPRVGVIGKQENATSQFDVFLLNRLNISIQKVPLY